MKKTVLFSALALLVASSGAAFAFRATLMPKPTYLQPMERQASRAIWIGNQTISAQFHIAHGSPVWKENYLEMRESLPVGQRFRLGKDFWTTFETNVPVTLGGTRLEPNYYYVAIERTEESFQLVLFEADRLRAKRIPSFQPPQQGGMTIPMTLTEEDDVTEDMTMDFVIDEGSSEVSLEISWGPFTLAAPVVAEIPTE